MTLGVEQVIHARPDARGDDLLAALAVAPPRGTIVLNGTTAAVNPDLIGRIRDVIVEGVAAVVNADGLTVLTGGTDAGIFSILGAAAGPGAGPLVGVAPAGRVEGPGEDTAALEAHHTHVVLIDGDDWGVETAALLGLAAALGRRAPVVAVLCGGGEQAREEALGHARAGRPLVVIAGSGRLADDLVAARAAVAGADGVVAEIAASPSLVVFPADAPGARLASVLHALLAR